MKMHLLVCVAMVTVTMPAIALADDPHDPAMHSAAAHAHDREMTRLLNRKELTMVHRRDASYARRNGEFAASSRDHERAMASYARRRSQYERDMAAWRRAVAACRAGDYSACDR